MTERFVYAFDWDISKAMANWLALSRCDVEHSQSEDRWITLGLAETGQLVVVVHTFEEFPQQARIRIISARYATARERRQYESS